MGVGGPQLAPQFFQGFLPLRYYGSTALFLEPNLFIHWKATKKKQPLGGALKKMFFFIADIDKYSDFLILEK